MPDYAWFWFRIELLCTALIIPAAQGLSSYFYSQKRVLDPMGMFTYFLTYFRLIIIIIMCVYVGRSQLSKWVERLMGDMQGSIEKHLAGVFRAAKEKA